MLSTHHSHLCYPFSAETEAWPVCVATVPCSAHAKSDSSCHCKGIRDREELFLGRPSANSVGILSITTASFLLSHSARLCVCVATVTLRPHEHECTMIDVSI